MRTTLTIGMLLLLAGTTVSAQVLRPCTDQKLSCKLENIHDFFHRTTLDSQTEGFSGLNEDEPSIPPEACTIVSVLSDKNVDTKKRLNYLVKLADNDMMGSIYVSADGKAAASDVSFVVTAGTKFYYRNNTAEQMLTCELSKETSPVSPSQPQNGTVVKSDKYFQCISDSMAATNSSMYPSLSISQVKEKLQSEGESNFVVKSALEACKGLLK